MLARKLVGGIIIKQVLSQTCVEIGKFYYFMNIIEFTKHLVYLIKQMCAMFIEFKKRLILFFVVYLNFHYRILKCNSFRIFFQV